jgi:hypothetical protein
LPLSDGRTDEAIRGKWQSKLVPWQNVIYYDAIIACIRDAESIVTFGPGDAKYELKKRLKKKLGGRIVGSETVDKMTGRQIV